jgi:hypothetical protein
MKAARNLWFRFRARTRRGIWGGAVLGSLVPIAYLQTPDRAAVALIMVPVGATLGGLAMMRADRSHGSTAPATPPFPAR